MLAAIRGSIMICELVWGPGRRPDGSVCIRGRSLHCIGTQRRNGRTFVCNRPVDAGMPRRWIVAAATVPR